MTPVFVRSLGRVDYTAVWRAMIDFTAARTEVTPDELWLCEHPPVYTLGQAGRPEDRIIDNGIPLLKVDRGGQITYHGPGQTIAYLLLDMKKRGLGVRELVYRMEEAVIELLSEYRVAARRLDGAPGVYVDQDDDSSGFPAKIAALGLRVSRSCCYHGLSLNVDMDLTPFSAINPCGYAHMPVTQTRDLAVDLSPTQAGEALAWHLIQSFSMNPMPRTLR